MNTTTCNETDQADAYTRYPTYQVSLWLWNICPPVLIVFGTLGNILCIIVLTRKSMRESSASVYLTVLSIVDISVLYTGLMRQWIRVVFGVDIRLLSELSCKIHLWINYFGLSMSVWLLVAVTVERLISVWKPHRVKTYCSRFTTGVTIAAISVSLFVLCSHVMYGLGDVVITPDAVTTYKRCEELWDDYSYFYSRIWPLIALLHFSLIPFFVLFIANLSIIYKVLTSSHMAQDVIWTLTSQQVKLRAKKMSSMTVTLLLLNAVFFVCTMPVCVFLVVRPSWTQNITPEHKAEIFLIEAIVTILMYANNATNFLMYCTCGSRFRETLKGLFYNIKGRR